MVTVKRAMPAIATLILSLTVLAGETGGLNDGSRSIELRESTMLLGVMLPPGTYTLRWARELGSEDVRLEVARGRRVLADGKGRWVASPQISPYEGLVYRAGRGASELAEIRFKRSAAAIRVDADAARADARTTTKADKD